MLLPYPGVFLCILACTVTKVLQHILYNVAIILVTYMYKLKWNRNNIVFVSTCTSNGYAAWMDVGFYFELIAESSV